MALALAGIGATLQAAQAIGSSSDASGSVGDFSFTVSSAAGGASAVAWNFRFAGAALGSGSTITVTAPPGTDMSDVQPTVLDLTTGATVGVNSSIGPAKLTLTLTDAVAARDLLAVSVQDVSNPAAGAAFSGVSLATSADPTPVSPSTGSFTGAAAVDGVTFHASTMVGGATGVTWVVRFRASDTTGGVAATTFGTASTSGELRLIAPGAVFRGCCDRVYDLTSGTQLAADHSTVTQSGETVHLYQAAQAGDMLELIQDGVTNPAPGAALSAITIATSSDTTPVPVGGGSFTSPQPVSHPSFAASTSAGGATGVNWSLQFTSSSSGRLAGNGRGGTINLSAPAGATFDAHLPVQVFDESSGGVLVGNDYPQVAGTDESISLSRSIGAGDVVEVLQQDVTNPPSATAMSGIKLSTSSDTTPVALGPGSFGAAGTVSDAAFIPSTTAGGATGVSWTFGFKVSDTGGLHGNGAIVIAGPSGTAFDDRADVTVYDQTSDTQVANAAPEVSGTSERIPVNQPVAAGDTLVLIQPDVTNPASGTAYSAISVSTTSDTTPLALGSESFTSAGSVGAAHFHASDAGGGADNVTWTTQFTLGATGALAATYGEIVITGPSGTSFGGSSPASVYDETTGDLVFNGAGTASGTSETLPLSSQAAAGDVLEVVLPGVTNPAGGITPGVVSVTTSSDIQAIHPAAFASAPAHLGSLSVTATTLSGGAGGVAWRWSFLTGSGGALSGDSGDTITLTAPSGTTLPATGGVLVLDDTTGASDPTPRVTLDAGSSSATISLSSGMQIGAGDQVSVLVAGVTNPDAGVKPASAFSVQTSAEPTAVNPATGLTFTDPSSAGSVAVEAGTLAGGATSATWAWHFTAGTDGMLVGPANGVDRHAQITLTAVGATLPGNAGCDVTLIDETNGALDKPCTAASSAGGATETFDLNPGDEIAAGDRVAILVSGVTNPGPGSVAAGSLTLSTTSDANAASPRAGLDFGPAAAPSAVSVSALDTAASATGVAWSVHLRTSATGRLSGVTGSDGGGELTVNAPAGTTLAGECGTYVIDETTGETDDPCFNAQTPVSNDGATETINLNAGFQIGPGDTVAVLFTGVTNPPTGSRPASAFTVQTTSDLVSGSPSSGIAFADSSTPADAAFATNTTAGGATDATWTWQFTTSSTGALSAGRDGFDTNGSITVNGPDGTTLPGGCGVIVIDDSTGDVDTLCFAGPANVTNNGRTDTLTLDQGDEISAGDHVTAILDGVTNPSAGPDYGSDLTLATSSDTPAATAGHATFSAPNQVGDATVVQNSDATGAISWAIRFTASRTGELSGGYDGHLEDGTITLQGDSHTSFTNECGIQFLDETNGATDALCGSSSGGGSQFVIGLGTNDVVEPGDRVDLAVPHVGAPDTSQPVVGVSTGSDTQSSAAASGEIPATTITGGASGTTTSRDATFTFTSSQDNSTFTCRLDGPATATGAPSACNGGSISYSNLADGTYTFSVSATGPQGLQDPEPAANHFTVSASTTGGGGGGRAVLTPSPTSLDFGTIPTGTTTSPKTLTVKNTGTAAGSPQLALTGPDAGAFQLIGDTCTGAHLAPSASCSVLVGYTSSASRRQTAAVTITDASTGAFGSVPLSGAGTATGAVRGTVLVLPASGPARDAHTSAAGGIVVGIEPAVGADVSICTFGARTLCRDEITGEDGTYTFTGLPAGSYQMEVYPTQADLLDGAAVPTIAPGSVVNQDFTLKQGAPLPPGFGVVTPFGTITSGVPRVWATDPISYQLPMNVPTHGTANSVTYWIGFFGLSPNTGATGSGPSEGAAMIASFRYNAQGVLARYSPMFSAPLPPTIDVADIAAAVNGSASTARDRTAATSGNKGQSSGGSSCGPFSVTPAGETGGYTLNFPVVTSSSGPSGPHLQSTTAHVTIPQIGVPNDWIPGQNPYVAYTVNTLVNAIPGVGAINTFTGLGNTIAGSQGVNPSNAIPFGGEAIVNVGMPLAFANAAAQASKSGFHGSASAWYVAIAAGAFGSLGVNGPKGPQDADPCSHSNGNFNIYFDPSGRVVAQHGIPLANAQVTLLRAPAKRTHLRPVPNGSATMSPANRRNPDRTTINGEFGWDVLPGFYQVTASHAGCTTPGRRSPLARSPLLTVPPPAFGLQLQLLCPHLARVPTHISLTVAKGPLRGVVVLRARVSSRSGTPTGAVTFRAGSRTIGTIVIDRLTRTATIDVYKPRGRVRAQYAGNARWAPSST